MSQSRSGSAFTVGFVLFVALGVLISAMFFIGSGANVLSQKVRFVSLLPSTSGLIEGSKVYLSGLHVGSVERIDFSDDLNVNDVRVTLAIGERYAPRVRENSKMWLATEGLLGDYAVHLATGEGPSLAGGGEIPFDERTMLEGMAGRELTSNTTALMQTMIVILKQIQSGQGTLGQLLKNPELYENLNSLVESVGKLSVDVEGITREARVLLETVNSKESLIGKILLSPEYETNIRSILSDSAEIASTLKATATVIQNGEGSVGKLVKNPELHDRLLAAVTKIEQLSEVATRTLGDVSKDGIVGVALRDEGLGQSFVETLTQIETSSRHLSRVLGMLDRGEGTAGVLLHDPSLAISMRNLFLGVQDLGYVRGLVNTAEMIGQEVARSDRVDARDADEIGRIVQGTSGDEGTTVPATGKEDDKTGSSVDRESDGSRETNK